MSTLCPRHAPSLHDTGPAHVVVAMGLCNGAPHLDEQLKSLDRQTHADWSLLVSDDGSTDDGPARLARWREARPDRRVTFLSGPQRGFAANYLSLLRSAPDAAPYLAFADQDDWWLPEKLARAVAALAPEGGRPALYCSRTIVADAALCPQRLSPRLRRQPSFAHALVQNIAGGNTMVMNRAALDRLAPMSGAAGGVVAHDWWVYQAVTGIGGRVIFDDRPSLLYRQHGANLIGAGDTVAAMFGRMRRVLAGEFRDWTDRHLAALDAVDDMLTGEARATLTAFRGARGAPAPFRPALLSRIGAVRRTRRGTAGLWAAACLGKV